MCGIVGFVAKDPAKHGAARAQFLEQGLWCDALRGTGGTGVAAIAPDGSIEVIKKSLPGPDFVHCLAWSYGFKNVDSAKIAIGHNRAATVGAVRDINCHPFHYEGEQEIVLVHNGTLSNHMGLTPKDFNHAVDSAHAAYALAMTTDEAALLKNVRGPFVFVWYNKTKNTFNIARNSFRDIYYMMSKDGDIFFASEWQMLDWLMARNDFDCQWKEYRSLEENEWAEWAFAEDGSFKKPVVRKITPEILVRPPVTAGGYRGTWDYSDASEFEYARWRGHSPRPTLLEELGFRPGENAYGEVDSFEPYSKHSPSRGIIKVLIEGSAAGEEYVTELHGMDSEEFDSLEKAYEGLVCVKLISARKVGDVITFTGSLNRKETAAFSGWSFDEAEDVGGLVPGPGGLLVPHADWQERVKQGCANCSDPIADKEYDKVVWLSCSPPAVLCQKCSSDTTIMNVLGVGGGALC